MYVAVNGGLWPLSAGKERGMNGLVLYSTKYGETAGLQRGQSAPCGNKCVFCRICGESAAKD